MYILDDHDEEGQLNAEGLVGVGGACDVVRGDVSAHDLEDRGLDVRVRYSLNVSISHALVPNLQRLGTKSNGVLERSGNLRGKMGLAVTYPME